MRRRKKPGHARAFSVALRRAQFDSVNWMYGVEPPPVEQLPRLRLLLSPVLPELATHDGAEVEPLVTASFAVIDEPVLNLAIEPPALPTTFHSPTFHTVARYSTLSLPLEL